MTAKLANEIRLKVKWGSVDAITPREEDIIYLMTDGLSNKEIAYHLGITVGTVKEYIVRFSKKNCISGHRAEIVAMAWRGELGIV